jgi:hypothetical protein
MPRRGQPRHPGAHHQDALRSAFHVALDALAAGISARSCAGSRNQGNDEPSGCVDNGGAGLSRILIR